MRRMVLSAFCVALFTAETGLAQNANQCMPQARIEGLRTQHAVQMSEYFKYLDDSKKLAEKQEALLEIVQECRREKNAVGDLLDELTLQSPKCSAEISEYNFVISKLNNLDGKIESQVQLLKAIKASLESALLIACPSSNAAQSVSGVPTTMTSKDGSFRITLPAGWIQASPSTPSQQLFAKNATLDAAITISAMSASDVQDWQVYAESIRVKILGNLNQGSSSEVKKIKVNGFDALQADFAGTLKNGLKLHYLGTMIKADNKLIQILTWCIESKFAASRKDFESLPFGMQL